MRYVGLWTWPEWGEKVESPSRLNGAETVCRACAAEVFGIAVVRAYGGLGRFPEGWKPIHQWEAHEQATDRSYDDGYACVKGDPAPASCEAREDGYCKCRDEFVCDRCGKDMVAPAEAAAA